MSRKKTTVETPDGDAVEVEKFPPFAVHEPLAGGKGYVVTHLPTWACVIRCRLKGDARQAARLLAWLWGQIPDDRLRWLVEELRQAYCCREK